MLKVVVGSDFCLNNNFSVEEEKTAALLQVLKETGMRVGDAWNLNWTDIDFINLTISVTPEKGSHARMFKVSNKLLAMINTLPKKSAKIFGTYDL